MQRLKPDERPGAPMQRLRIRPPVTQCNGATGAGCNGAIRQGLWANPRVGSPRRFCDPACRQAAYRRRRAGVAEDTPRQVTGGRDRRLTDPSIASGKEVTTPAHQA